MVRQFFKDSAIYGIASLMVTGVSFLLLPLYTRTLTQADYGATDLLGALNNLASIIVPLIIIAGVERFYTGSQSEKEKIAYASTALWFTVGAYTIFVLICYPLAEPIARLLLNSPDLAGVFRLFLVATWGYGIFSLVQYQLRLMLQSKRYALVSVISAISAIGITIFLVIVMRLGVMGVVGGWCAQYFIGGILSFYFSRKVYALQFHVPSLKEMLRFSLPLVPSTLAIFAIVYVDRVVLRMLMTMEDVGLFAVAYKLVTPIYLINSPIANTLNPLIYTHFREAETPRKVARIFRYIIALSLLIFAGYSLFATEIVAIMAPPNYAKAADILPLMAWVMILNLLPVFAPGLSIAKKTGILAIINSVVAVLSTLLNFILVPYLGVVGSALSNLFGLLTLFYLRMYFSQKYYPIPFEWKRTGLAIIAVTMLIVFGLLIRPPFWTWLVFRGLLFFSAIGAIFSFRLVEREEISQFWILVQRYFRGISVKHN